MFIQAFRKPNSLENDSALTSFEENIDPTWDPLIRTQIKQVTRFELCEFSSDKGFINVAGKAGFNCD